MAMKHLTKTLSGFLLVLVCCLQTACDSQSSAESTEPSGSIQVRVEGMSCINCVRHLQNHFTEVEEVRSVFVSLPNRVLLLGLFPGQELTDEQLTESVKAAGYEATGIQRSETPFTDAKQALQ